MLDTGDRVGRTKGFCLVAGEIHTTTFVACGVLRLTLYQSVKRRHRRNLSTARISCLPAAVHCSKKYHTWRSHEGRQSYPVYVEAPFCRFNGNITVNSRHSHQFINLSKHELNLARESSVHVAPVEPSVSSLASVAPTSLAAKNISFRNHRNDNKFCDSQIKLCC